MEKSQSEEAAHQGSLVIESSGCRIPLHLLLHSIVPLQHPSSFFVETMAVPATVVLGALALVLWTVYVALWRLFWSPLSKFPGPKLAALTLWYEFYFDVIKGGMYIWEIERMHKKYGTFWANSRHFRLLIQKAPLYVSVHTNCTLAIRNSTTRYTRRARARGTSIRGRSKAEIPHKLWASRFRTIFTACADKRWIGILAREA